MTGRASRPIFGSQCSIAGYQSGDVHKLQNASLCHKDKRKNFVCQCSIFEARTLDQAVVRRSAEYGGFPCVRLKPNVVIINVAPSAPPLGSDKKQHKRCREAQHQNEPGHVSFNREQPATRCRRRCPILGSTTMPQGVFPTTESECSRDLEILCTLLNSCEVRCVVLTISRLLTVGLLVLPAQRINKPGTKSVSNKYQKARDLTAISNCSSLSVSDSLNFTGRNWINLSRAHYWIRCGRNIVSEGALAHHRMIQLCTLIFIN